jgi:hypothetical protein
MTKKAKVEEANTTDEMWVKFREKELDPALLNRINNWLKKPRNHDTSFITHDLIDRLLEITEDKGVQFAINYFRWRNEGTMTRQELFSTNKEIEIKLSNDDIKDLNKQIGEMQEQLNDMQHLIMNIGFSLNDELKDRRLRAV